MLSVSLPSFLLPISPTPAEALTTPSSILKCRAWTPPWSCQERYECMECLSGWPAGKALFFAEYKSDCQRYATMLAAVRSTGRIMASAWSPFQVTPKLQTMMLEAQAPSDCGLHPRRRSGRLALWRQRGQVLCNTLYKENKRLTFLITHYEERRTFQQCFHLLYITSQKSQHNWLCSHLLPITKRWYD